MGFLFTLIISFTCGFASFTLADPAEVSDTPKLLSVKGDQTERWSVYYGSDLPAEKFVDYDVVVFDGIEHPPLRLLRNRGQMTLGYISLGEAEDYRQDFDKLKKMGVLLEENPSWPGHYIVDIRKPEWAKYIIEEKIPEILFQRFDGVMFDTLDSPLYLLNDAKGRYKDMKEASVRLLKAIRMHYPDMIIMLNRGYDAFPEIAPYIDMSLAESTLVKHLPNEKSFAFFDDDTLQYYQSKIMEGIEANNNLKVYSLDYWDLKDEKTVKDIYARQRALGYVPYVSSIDLQSVFPEPK